VFPSVASWLERAVVAAVVALDPLAVVAVVSHWPVEEVVRWPHRLEQHVVVLDPSQRDCRLDVTHLVLVAVPQHAVFKGQVEHAVEGLDLLDAKLLGLELDGKVGARRVAEHSWEARQPHVDSRLDEVLQVRGAGNLALDGRVDGADQLKLDD
jgi:hypothetical protein